MKTRGEEKPRCWRSDRPLLAWGTERAVAELPQGARLGPRERGPQTLCAARSLSARRPLSSLAPPPGSTASWQVSTMIWGTPRCREWLQVRSQQKSSRTSTPVTHTHRALGRLVSHEGADRAAPCIAQGAQILCSSVSCQLLFLSPQDVFPVPADGKAFVCCLLLVFCFKVQTRSS